MELSVGDVLEGKVTGIMKFGAFVSLPGGRSGLVHISEIAFTYVNEVGDHLAMGQTVKVKVIGIDETGRINLSVKKAMEPPPGARRPAGPALQARPAFRAAPPAPASFEDKLKQFMQDSDNKMYGVKQYSEKKPGRRGKRGGYDE